MSKLNLAASITLCSLININSVWANESWLFGIAAQTSNGPYESSEVLVAPLIVYEKNRLELSTLDGASFRVFDIPKTGNSEGSLSLNLSPRMKPDFGSASIYSGINRKNGLDAGLTGQFQYQSMVMKVRGAFDLTDAHNGFELSAELGYQSQKLPIELGVGARYRDANLNQYLFGIDSTEVIEGKAEFNADGNVTGFVNAMAALPITKKLITYTEVSYEHLGSLSDSPLVSPDDGFTTLTLGVVYQWK